MIAILYEHPEWFELLFGELERRRIPFERLHAECLTFDPEARSFPDLVVNRMSPSAWRRGHGNGIFTVKDYLVHLEEHQVTVVNGSRAYAVEISKVRQLDLFRRAGVAYPRARVINHPSLAAEAARDMEFPVVGSDAGIARFDSLEQLGAATPDLGIDGTALVQESLPARGGSIVRVEVLNGEFLYAIRIFPDFTSFNLCTADICQTDYGVCAAEAPKKRLRIECAAPPPEAIEAALPLAQAAHLDIGGLEYLINDRNDEVCFCDINALSNFVTDAVNVVGFDPTARFVDYLERRHGAS